LHRASRLGRRLRAAAGVVAFMAGCSGDGHEVVLVGTLERTLVELSAPVSEVIIEVPVERGQRVEPDQVLVRLDPVFAEVDVAAAEAAVASARSADATGAHELRRVQGLRERNVASIQDLERAQLARDEVAARLREATARLAAAHKHLADLTIASPVAGVVDQLPFDVGERVPAGSVLAIVLERGEPWVRVWIPERAFTAVVPGARAEVRIDGVRGPLGGRVLDVAREPEFTPHYALTERERVHLVYETRVVVEDAPDDLRPGVPAEVRIELPAALHAGDPGTGGP
jgi:HlyD family secretion protein